MVDMAASEALFVRDGEWLIPSPLAEGPWAAGQLHGSPVAGLIARAVDRVSCPFPMRVAKVSLDLLRGVPMQPLSVAAEVVRQGARIQLLDVTIRDEARLLVRASVLRIRVNSDLEVPVAPAPRAPRPPAEDECLSGEALAAAPAFFGAIDYARTALSGEGDAVMVWTRLRVALVAGEEISPLVRLAVAADFTSGSAVPLDHRSWFFINPDLTIHVVREPVGEWIGVKARADLAADGIGQGRSTIFDRLGSVARGQASMWIGPRPAADPATS